MTNTKSKHLLPLLCAGLLTGSLALTSAGHAANLFWDGADTDANANGGNGTWNTVTPNWDTAVTGGASAIWNNATPDTATFGGATGTVTLGSNITAGSLTFNTAGYTIAQDVGNLYALTIGAGGVNLGGGSATINGKLTGANNWTANWGSNGSSTLTIGGSVANDSTGTITALLPGHLILAKTGGAMATAGNLILLNNPVRLSGGDQTIGGTTEFQAGTNARLHPRGFTYTTRGLIGTTGVIENSSSFYTPGVSNTAGVVKIKTISGDSFTYSGFLRDTDSANGGTIALVKEGLGTQTLSGTNALLYTGATTITGGTLRIAPNGNSGWASAVGIGSAGTLELNSTNATIDTVRFTTNALAFTGSGTITKTGTGYFGLLLGVGVKDFTGLIDIQQGVLGNNGTGWAAGAGVMDLNIESGAVFDMRTQNVKIDGLTGGITAKITSSHNQAVNLSVGNNDGNATFNGTINNGSFAPIAGGLNTGTISLTKVGSGTQTLTGASTYSGGTIISAGTLNIGNTTGSATGSGPVTINAVGVLSGTGSIVGGTVSLFGTVSPGNSVGTLFADNFNWQAGGTYDWEIDNFLGSTPGVDWDLLDLTGGNLTFVGGGPFNVDIDASAFNSVPNGDYLFEIARADNVINFNASNFALNADGPANAEWSILQQGDSVFLQATVTPEPSAWSIFAIGGMACLLGGNLVGRRRSKLTQVLPLARRGSGLRRK